MQCKIYSSRNKYKKRQEEVFNWFFFFWRGLVRGSVMAGNFLARFRKQSSWRRRWNSRRNSTHSGKEKQRGVCRKYCEYSGVLLLPHKEQKRVVISRSLGLLGYSSIQGTKSKGVIYAKLVGQLRQGWNLREFSSDDLSFLSRSQKR